MNAANFQKETFMLSTIVRSLACAVALLALFTAPANAQPLDKRVIFNFSGPVSLPGVTLPTGSYLFRVPTPNRNVVQVLSPDGTKSYGLFFAIPAHSNVRPEKPEVRFMETSSSMPHAIRTWWYPADSTGFEFIYPKDRQAARQRYQRVGADDEGADNHHGADRYESS